MQVLVDMLLSRIGKYNPGMSEAQLKTRKYGLEVLLGELSKALIYLLVFSLFSLTGHYLLSMLIFCTIRTSTGGYHARSYLGCFIITFIMFSAILFAGKYFEPSIAVKSIMLALSLIITILFAPVMHKNVTRKNKERADHFKLMSILLVVSWSGVTYFLRGAWSATAVFTILAEAIMQPLGKLLNPMEKCKTEDEGGHAG